MHEPPTNPPECDPKETGRLTGPFDVIPQISAPGETPGNLDRNGVRSSTFAAGDIVAKRFRIERFIAQGGMGEVYEAIDLELKQKVALKTIRSVLIADEKALKRFRQEIVVAKRVTHPSVCRTFDLFRHESVTEGTDDVLVVSMEFLCGSTLDQHLVKKGKLTTKEALPLVGQMIAALHAAHEAGVVHRDFKTSNVILVDTGNGNVRVVVTDFGLAHSLDLDEFALTRSGEILGTPAFMAPEQVTGKEITPATDIYALGVVMFELVTGRLPFQGSNWRDVAFKRLTESPPVPKILVPDLDDRWSRTILKCLEREPADRFAQVQEIESSLSGETETRLRDETSASQRRKRSLLAALALAVIAVVGIVTGIKFPNLFLWGRSPAITVLGFKNVSGDKKLDSWGDQFRMTLRSELDVRPVSYKTLDSMGNPWSPPPPSEMPEEPPPDLLARFRQLGCRYVVYGTYQVEGNPGNRTIVWDIHLFDVDKGQSGGSLHKTLLESDREIVAMSAGGELRKMLGVSEVHGTERTISNIAGESYGTGMRKMENFDFEGARIDFQKALDAVPTNAEIRSALAEALWRLGYEEKAREEADVALAQAESLFGDQKIRISLRQKQYAKQWDSAAETYRALWKTQHDNYFYGLELARNQMEGNHLDDSLETLRLMKGNEVPKGVQAQADLLIADVQSRLGDNQERLDAARQAAAGARAIGAQYLGVNAGIQQCLALKDLGRIDEAEKLCKETVDQSLELGIVSVTAHAKSARANLFLSREQYSEAERLYEEAHAAAHSIGDLRDEAGALFNLGLVQYQENNLPAARKLWQSSLEVSRTRGGVNDDLMRAQEAIAEVDAAMGNTKGQINTLEEIISEASAIGDKGKLANSLGNLCGALISSGEVYAARANCERALQLHREMRDKSAEAGSLTDLGDYFSVSDDLGEAESNYRAALAIQNAIGEKLTALVTRRGLAEIKIDLKEFVQAQVELKALVSEFTDAKDAYNEALTRSALASLYIKTGQLREGLEENNKALAYASKSADPALQAEVSIQKARWEIKMGDSTAAATDLNAVEEKMRASGFLELALEAKLARAETLTGSNRTAELQTVATEAKAHGYLLLARKTRELSGQQ
jgi:eukaryotic-like serine/threonine-protein kinase